MSAAKEYFVKIGSGLDDSIQGKLFGKDCFKIKGKAYACFFQEDMVFKLSGEIHETALSLDGSKLFDPSGKGRPMKEWVQVSYSSKKEWKKFAMEALEYVSSKS